MAVNYDGCSCNGGSGGTCASPTTPTATVGLCLADGTPIAVTVVRDCDGAVMSEGWLNLTTGAWSAGAVPAGTVACGDSRSIQVSGTFCDVLPDGTVAGLVLVEYTYDDTGAIASVRLVDATTGSTYTPTGTVTTCPAGVEQPEQDAVLLCDTAAAGTATPFLRDFRRDENGAITGHSDYTLNGAAYTPAGTVGRCTEPPCETVAAQTFRLCDLNPAVEPDADGLRCATPFLRHYTYGCDGTATFHDTEMDGSTPYAPVEVVDCGGNPPSLREQVWNTVSIAADPSDPSGATIIYTVANSENPAQTGTVKMTASKAPGDGCTTSPTAPVWNGPVTFVFEPDATVMELASVLRVDALDWDDWEDKFIPSGGPSGGGFWPVPDRVEADLAFTNVTATRWHSTVANNTGHFYFSGPPAAVAMGNRNDGGGLACITPSFGFITLVPGPPCGVEECLNCETLMLCDDGADDPARITGTTSSGTLANGITWQAKGTSAAQTPGKTNTDGAWWALGIFPNPAVPSFTWTFSRAVDIEFSVMLLYSAASPTQTQVQLPPGVQPVSLPPGYHFDAATSIVSGDSTLNVCGDLNNPSQAKSARFRLSGAATSFTLQPLGARIAICGQFNNWWLGAITVTPTGQFLRTVCRNCAGTVTSVTNTELDGVTPYTPRGTAGPCAATCSDCETLTLCDQTAVAARIPYAQVVSKGGTLANGVSWATDGSAGPADTDAVYIVQQGASFVNFSRSADVTMSVRFTGADDGCLSMPAEAFLVGTLPATMTYDPDARLLCPAAGYSGETATFAAEDITALQFVRSTQGDTAANAAAVTFDVAVLNRATFLRTVCRACDGLWSSTVDTAPDGSTPYLVTGKVVDCAAPVDPGTLPGCCQPVQVCIQPPAFEMVEFVSNFPRFTDDSVDPTWQWTPDNNGLAATDPNFGPSATATWWPMYRPSNVPTSRWTIQDSAATNKAYWITPHPQALTTNTGAPGEGPALPAHWFGRAYFDLPANTDPNTIGVQVTALNADQQALGFRLNSGAWQNIALPQGGFNSGPPENSQVTTFGPAQLPGAQPGRNYLYMHINETVIGSGQAGVLVHMIVTYETIDRAQRSWTRMVCCNDDVYYIDQFGQRQEVLPAGWSLVPCAGDPSNANVVLTAQHKLLTAAQQWNSTDVTGTLTSVSYSVLSGTANVVDQDGTAANGIPAGVTATWDVEGDTGALQGPQTITAGTGSTVYVWWAQRA